MLYWPVLPDAKALPEETLAKIDAYMKQGGLIIFDTQDYGRGLAGGSAPGSGESALAADHRQARRAAPRAGAGEPRADQGVLSSAQLPRPLGRRPAVGRGAGRLAAQDQARRARVSDGVTSIIVTPNDLAAAWALDEGGRPLYPTVGGGEDQREMAFRTGINIVMHALTGNYKADQVHVPALLERLGQ